MKFPLETVLNPFSPDCIAEESMAASSRITEQPTLPGSNEPAALSEKELAEQSAREIKGILYLEKAIYAFADKQYADALKLTEKKAIKPTHYALALKAYILMELPGRDKEGKAILESIKAQPSSGIEDDIGKAWLYLREDNTEEAIRHADLALLKDERNARAYRIRGEAKASQSNYDEAIADYTLAIECNADNAMAYCLRAISYCKNNNLDQAIIDSIKAVEVRPGFDLVRDNLVEACHQRAWKRYQNNDNAGAIEDYTQILALNPQDIMALNNRGLLWKRNGNLAKAQKDFQAGLAIAPENTELQKNLQKLCPPPKPPRLSVKETPIVSGVNTAVNDFRAGLPIAPENAAPQEHLQELLPPPKPPRSLVRETQIVSGVSEVITRLAAQKGYLSK